MKSFGLQHWTRIGAMNVVERRLQIELLPDFETQGVPQGFGAERGRGNYFAIMTSMVSSRLCGASSSSSTVGRFGGGGTSKWAARWAPAVSSVLWNFTLTILLTPCSCIVTP